MSLLKQLFLAICLFLLVAFTGSFVVSLEESRDQLVSQLRSHAQDAATALGLSLSPHVDDPAMQELMVSSIFDSGYFSSIRILRVSDEQILVERTADERGSDAVPDWFIALVDLQPQGGEATLMRGWEQAARVQVVSHPRFALERLWDSALGTLYWLLGCGLVSAAIGGWLLRLQLQPLDAMVKQAEAITERIFYNLPKVPRTPELRRVVLAMNQMVDKLQMLFNEEAARSETLRRASWRDELTGLANRRLFDMQLQALLTPSDTSSPGVLLLLHLDDLAGLNERLGGQTTDHLITDIASLLRQQAEIAGGAHWVIARTRGADFAVLAPGLQQDDARQLAGALAEGLRQLGPDSGQLPGTLGITHWQPGEEPGKVLARADQAMVEAAANLNGGWRQADSDLPVSSHHDWHALLDDALNMGHLALYLQPVYHTGEHRTLWHYKVLARVIGPQGEPLAAGHFLPWVRRFGWTQRLDMAMLQRSLDYLATHPRELALSLSSESLSDENFRHELLRLLTLNSTRTRWLTIELDARHLPDRPVLESLCKDIRQAGGNVALQHFGGQFSSLGNLAQLGLGWLKIDGSFIRHIEQSEDRQNFVSSIRRATGHIDLPLLAEMVETEEELACLTSLGVEGVMGRLTGLPKPVQEMPN